LIRGKGTRAWSFMPLSTAAKTRKSARSMVRITVGSNFIFLVSVCCLLWMDLTHLHTRMLFVLSYSSIAHQPSVVWLILGLHRPLKWKGSRGSALSKKEFQMGGGARRVSSQRSPRFPSSFVCALLLHELLFCVSNHIPAP